MKSAEEIQSFLNLLANLMKMEETAESEELQKEIGNMSLAESENRGLILTKLLIIESDIYSGGRFYYRLQKPNRVDFGFSRISVGSAVSLVFSDTKEEILKGIVQSMSRNEIKIISEDSLSYNELKAIYQMNITTDNITYKRVYHGIQDLKREIEQKKETLLIHLLRSGNIEHWKFLQKPLLTQYENVNLNQSQKNAIQQVLYGLPLVLIHGPPGTGKTRTLLNLIKELVSFQKKILVCAGTNVATDFLAEGLLAMKIKVVRIGHPARIDEQLQAITFDRMLDQTEAGKLAIKFEKELSEVIRQKEKRKQKGNFLDKEEFQSEKNLIFAYRQEIQKLNRQSVQEMFSENVVFCTTATGASSEDLKQLEFDYVIIDEAAQILLPICFLALRKGKSFILAGDHLQLSPTIFSKEAAKKGLEQSIFERWIHDYHQNSVLLNLQYRMHQDIAGFSSKYFYNNEVMTYEKNKTHTLQLSENCVIQPLQAILFIDTAGADYEESFVESRKSYINQKEAITIHRLVDHLLTEGLPQDAIGVIAPYRTQVEQLKNLILQNSIEINTVDSFQGREKDCIIISLTRSNASQNIGFLAEERRLNVAITRARKKLILIGDSSTLIKHTIFKELLDYLQNIDGYHSIWEFTDLMP